MAMTETFIEKRRWTPEENAVILTHDAAEWEQLLPDRTKGAIRHRAQALGRLPYKVQPRSPFADAVKAYRESHPGIPSPLEVLIKADELLMPSILGVRNSIPWLGDRLYLARTLQGLDRDTAARLAKVSATAWRSWEQSQAEPPVSKLARAAAVLNVPIVWLLYGQRNDPWQP